jgi:cytoskeletal protein CcmA (bactofilin family)
VLEQAAPEPSVQEFEPEQAAPEPPVQEYVLEQAAPEPPVQEYVPEQAAPEPSVQEYVPEQAVPEPPVQEYVPEQTVPVASASGEPGASDVAEYAGAGEGDQAEEPKRSLSIISDDAYIDGNVTTNGNIEILGGISGDVSAKGAVDVRGAIRGNVSGEKLGLYGCTVQGDMRASAGILVDSESMVIGNVRTKNIYLDGKLKGNIESDEVSLLRSNAYYVGDIVTGSIAIEGGATISGNIRTLIEGDVEDPFRPDRVSGAR